MNKKVLVIDDSALMRRVISDIINSENDFEVTKIARNGLEGYEEIVSNPNLYDVVVMDINMPKMTGLEVLERLQKDGIRQVIVVASTLVSEGAQETLKALELGAFDFVKKPDVGVMLRDNSFGEQLIKIVKLAAASGKRKSLGFERISNARVEGTSFSRAVPNTNRTVTGTREIRSFVSNSASSKSNNDIQKVIALAVSTGGPKSLQSVIPKLPANIDAPILLVQHMPRGFTASLAERLDSLSKIHVKEAEDGDLLVKGTAYIAPGGRHMYAMRDTEGRLRIKIDDAPAVDALRPCANLMYNSLADLGIEQITCVVMTGMGSDGTKGITSIINNKSNKKVYVIAQDESTSIVYGMPKAIYEAGLVNEVCPLLDIADAITKNVGVS